VRSAWNASCILVGITTKAVLFVYDDRSSMLFPVGSGDPSPSRQLQRFYPEALSTLPARLDPIRDRTTWGQCRAAN
jgi:hypothetical protein